MYINTAKHIEAFSSCVLCSLQLYIIAV